MDRSTDPSRTYHSIFVGAGPAGLGPLVYAAGAGLLEDFLKHPVALIEQSGVLGSGTFGRYRINTNSKGGLFLECLRGERAERLPKAARSAAAAEISRSPEDAVPMKTVGALLQALGADIDDAIRRSAASRVFLYHRAEAIHLRTDGTYDVDVVSSGGRSVLRARRLVLATGAAPLIQPKLCRRILARCGNAGASNVLPMHSDEMLSQEGYCRVVEVLRRRPGSQIVIIGSGDSAFSVAWLLLEAMSESRAEASIALLHRSPPKLTFDNAQAAHDVGYHDFTQRDICPQSGILFRIGGLRFDARNLCLSIFNERAPRIRLVRMTEEAIAGDAVDWGNVALVVFAVGYACREVPIFESSGARVSLLGSFTGKYVDGRSRILRANGESLPNVFAIGLGSGFLPMEGGFGGEPSFDGLANSVLLCQAHVGAAVFEGLTIEAVAGRETRLSDRYVR